MDLKYLDRAFETKTSPDGTFEGYGSVFGIVDSYSDIIERGAFLASLASWRVKGRMPAMLWQHKGDEPIGVWLDMREDERGLRVRGKLLKDDVQRAREAYALMKAGALDGLSIGYRVPPGGSTSAGGIRTLRKLDLMEVSPVALPACDDARIDAVRSAGELRTTEEIVGLLTEVGYSRWQAEEIAQRAVGTAGKSKVVTTRSAQDLWNTINRDIGEHFARVSAEVTANRILSICGRYSAK